MRYVGAPSTSFGEDRRKYVVGSGGVSVGQTVFNVSYDEGKVDAYLNGVRLFPDTDFTKTASGVGSNITLTSGVASGDVLELQGLQGVHGGNGLVEDRFVVGTGSTGSGGSYTNSTTVFPSASNAGDTVSVWRNGVKLVHTTDYTVQPSASTVTLGSAATTDDEICIQVVGIVASANFITTASLLDEDNFSSNSATKPASQQSIKAYVDTADALKANVANTNMTGTATGVNLTLSGNLTVNGSTVTADTTNTVIKDNLIGLNNGVTSNANDAGLIIERGSTGNDALIMWDESADKWTLGTSTSNASSTGNLNITVGTLVANIEGNVTGDVTGNVSGTSATVTGATQSNITSVGTLTSATISGDLTVDTSTLKVDSSNNRVGIGISSSITDALHVKTTAVETRISLESSTGKWAIGAEDGDKFGILNYGTSTPFTINSSGNVGIGSADAAGPLEIFKSGTTISSNAKFIARLAENNDPMRGVSIGYLSDEQTGVIASATSAAASNLSFWTFSGSAWGERVRINSDGNVAIGVATGNDRFRVKAVDGTIGNNHLVDFRNEEATAGDNYGVYIKAGSNSSDYALLVHDKSGNERLKVDGAGTVHVGTGDLKIGTAGKGILFTGTNDPAPESGTGSDNLLDDYEYGTFDATCANSVTLHSHINSMSYLKIGRQVTVSGQVRVDSDNSNATFYINNLPFVCMGSGASEHNSLFVGACRTYSWDLAAACKWVICQVDAGENNAYFFQIQDNAVAVSLSAYSDAYMMFTVTYFTA